MIFLEYEQHELYRVCTEIANRFLVGRSPSVRIGHIMSTMDNKLAFERLVRPHFDRLYRLAWRLAGSKAEAEDLFQELLIKAYGKIDDLATIDQPGPWLCRVMYNLFIDEKRRFARQRMHTVDEGQLSGDGIEGFAATDSSGSDPVAENQRIEKIRRLDTALAQLSDEHRIVVLLHDTEGYKLKEIQELTGTPVGTIKSRLHRARARLREILSIDGTVS
jgi:RNA polymerase sigma-70 factor (ECF subfamily)